MTTSRRAFTLSTLSVMGTFIVLPRTSSAAPNPKLLQNRLELWANYARRTKNVLARLVTTRETSLLDEPLVTTGSLVYAAPDTLVLRDDGLSGSATLIEGNRVHVVPNQTTLERPPTVEPGLLAAQAWLAERLLRLFRPPQGDEGERDLIADARVDVPRKSFRVELMPSRGSVVRKTFRSITVHLDPVVGAVTQVVVAQTQGDRVRMQITDHRQNVEAADVEAVVQTVRERTQPDDAQ